MKTPLFCLSGSALQRLRSLALLGAAGLILQPQAGAATQWWDISNANGIATGTGNWSTSTSDLFWATSATPGTAAPTFWTDGNDAVFIAGSPNINSAVMLNGTVNVNSITMANSSSNAAAATITGGTSPLLILGAGGISNLGNGTLTINAAIRLAANQTWNAGNIGTGGSTTIGGVISDNGLGFGITKTGSNTLTFNGAAVNTYTGATTINDGGALVLDFANLATPTDLINSSSALTLGGGGLTVKGKTGAFATSQTLGNLTLTANSGQSALTLNQNSGTSTNLTLGNTWTRGAGTTLSVTAAAGTTVTTSAALTNGLIGGYAVVTIGSSVGFLTVSAGKIAVASTSGLTAAVNDETLNFSANASVTHNSGNWSANSISLNGGGLDIGGGVLTLKSGGVLNRGTGSGTDVISNGQLGASGSEVIVHEMQARSLEISATISGGTGSFTKGGGANNKVILTGENTYTGITVVGAGTLQIGNDGTTGSISSSSSVIVRPGTSLASGAVLAYNRTDASTINNLTGGGNLVVNSGQLTLLQSAGSNNALGTATGATGAILIFGGDATAVTSIGNPGQWQSIGYFTTAGMLYKFTSGTVNLIDVARDNIKSNIEVDGGILNFVNGQFEMTGTAGQTQTLTIKSGELNALAGGGVASLGATGGVAQSNGTVGGVFLGTQTGGTINTGATQGFGLGSATGSQTSTYNLSGGSILSSNTFKLGADMAGTSTTTFNFSGGKIVEKVGISGAQGAGAKQAFVWTGGTLSTLQFDATNLTSTSGDAVVLGSTNTLTNGGGILAPGDISAAGRTLISGNYNVTSANAGYSVDIGGTTAASTYQAAPGAYDQTIVTGTTVLGGRLDFNFINGYTPPANTTTLFAILRGNVAATSTVTGAFTNQVVATGGNSRVVGADGLSSFLIAVNNTASTAIVGGLTNVGSRNVALGGYQATNTYTGSGTDWDTANAGAWANFDPGATATPASQASNAIAQFADGTASTGAIAVSLNSTRNVQGVQFASAAGSRAYTINNGGGGTLILDNTSNSAAATITDTSTNGTANSITVPVALNSNLAVSITNAANNLTLSGAISGTGKTLTKTGLGTLTLSGDNTYTGATTVSAGTLALGGNLAGALAVNSGATLSMNGARSVAGATFNSGATVALGITSSSTFDSLTSAGAIVFNGTLYLNFTGNFTENTTLSLFSAVSYSGGFTSIIASGVYSGVFSAGSGNTQQLTTLDGGTFNFNNDTGDLSYLSAAIPEPASAAILAALSVSLAVALRRRARHA